MHFSAGGLINKTSENRKPLLKAKSLRVYGRRSNSDDKAKCMKHSTVF